MTAPTPDRDETGARVGFGPLLPSWLPVGTVVLALVVGLLFGWALGAGGDGPPEPAPAATTTTADDFDVASCRRAVTIARQGFGYAAAGLRAAGDAITALEAGFERSAEEAAKRLQSEIASIMDASPRFNAAADAC